jgi:hypothetical protein
VENWPGEIGLREGATREVEDIEAVLAVTGRDIVYSAPLVRETSKQRDVATHASREEGVISVLHGTGGLGLMSAHRLEQMHVTNYPVGWTCELIIIRIERYLVGALPRGEALAVAEHIEACIWCAERVAMVRLLGETRAAPKPRPHARRAPSGGAGARRRGGRSGSRDRGK